MKLTARKRNQVMVDLAMAAAFYDRHGDATLRTQRSQAWRELATAAEAKRAPHYLTWLGRTEEK